MKKHYLSLWLILMTLVLWGCKSPGPLQDPGQALPSSELHQDLDYLFETIKDVNPAFHNNPDLTESLQRDLDQRRQQITDSLNSAEFYIQVAPAVTSINDGHTDLSLPWDKVGEFLGNGGVVFPLDIFFIEREIFIYNSYRKDSTLAAGTQILAINQVSAGQILADLQELLAGGNLAWRLRRMEGQSDFFKVLLWLRYGWEQEYDLDINRDGIAEQVTVAGITRAELHTQRMTGEIILPWEYQALDQGAGLLTVRHFGEEDKAFEQFLNRSFSQMKEDGITDLILDIRDNPGGRSNQAELLLSYFASDPFHVIPHVSARATRPFKQQMKQRIPWALRWLPVQYLDSRGRAIWRAEPGEMVPIKGRAAKPQPASQRFTGNSYVLINEGTFSTAAIFASASRRLDVGTLVGRPTGGVDGVMYAEPLQFRLPNSRLHLQVSAMQFGLHDEPALKSISGVLPDVFIEKSLNDEINKDDTILQAAKAMVSEHQTRQSLQDNL